MARESRYTTDPLARDIERGLSPAYIDLASETGVTPPDCLQIAQLLKGSGRHDEALEWVERGVGLGSDTFEHYAARRDLARLKRDLLVQLGRGREALASAWSEYAERTSRDGYDELMRLVPVEEREAWHPKAIDAAQGARLDDRVELLIATDETDRLAELVRGTADDRLEDLSHVFAEPAAAALEQVHPDTAARPWRAQGMGIVNAGMSLCYGNAVQDFENARRCFGRAGAADEWSRTARGSASATAASAASCLRSRRWSRPRARGAGEEVEGRTRLPTPGIRRRGAAHRAAYRARVRPAGANPPRAAACPWTASACGGSAPV